MAAIDWLKPATSEKECRERLALLSEQYAAGRSDFRSHDYDEATVRQDFIDPMFAALGWDVANMERKFGKEREVVPEAKATGQRDRPDYAFTRGGKPKFFVEAKRPAVDPHAPQFIFQAKTYAYSRSAPACVLTNFEHFMVFHAALAPHIDEPDVGRLTELDLTYENYAEKADLLWRVLGRPNVFDGSIENYVLDIFAQRRRRPTDRQLSLLYIRGAKPVDKTFLDHLSAWRGALAEALAKTNHMHDTEAVAEAVQRILDRLVFIRVCEDRGIEQQLVLKPVLDAWIDGQHPSLYSALVDLFHRLEPEYNSHLFKRHFSEGLKFADEGTLRRIIDQLYPPQSPYRFDALPVDILGTVYERFLGETVEFNQAGDVQIVETPEVRHRGGIVYTPRWVVREVVERTIGPRIHGKAPGALGNIRIIDPACGSGSFLLGAAEALFDAHLAWYRENALEDGKIVHEHRSDVFVDAADELQLTVKKRREIILHCLYGVDKDPQAVEVAQLSLYLRILEGYGEQSFIKQKTLFKGALLPDLSKNIRNGNSLITPSDIPQEVVFDDERLRRARAFDWNSPTRGFGRIAAQGGFDAVIGNPPYIRIQELKKFAPDEVDVMRAIYPAAADGNFDIYLAFVEKGLKILKPTGGLGLILPLRWTKANYGKALRERIGAEALLSDVVDFGADQVFEGVTTYTALQFFGAQRTSKIRYSWVNGGSDDEGLGSVVREHSRSYRGSGFENGKPWYLGVSPALSDLFDRLRSMENRLETAAKRISQGIKTGRDGIFVLHKATLRGDVIRGTSKESDRVVEVEADACKWLIKSAEMQRYHLRRPSRAVMFPYAVSAEGKVRLLRFPQLKERWPHLAAYLEEHEEVLRAREPKIVGGRRELPFDKDDEWHQFSRFQNMDLPGLQKIVVADVLNYSRFAFDEGASVCFMGGAAGGYGIVLKPGWNYWAVTATLNSSILEWMLRPPGFSDWYAGAWFSGESRFIEGLPLLPPDHASTAKLAKAGERLHGAHQKLAEAVTDSDRERWRNVISSDETTIDELVFSAFRVSKEDRLAVRAQVEELRRLCGAGEEETANE
jgi:hypothetical protein